MSLNGRSLNQAIRDLLVKQITLENQGLGANPILECNSASQILSIVGELRASLALSSKGGTAFYHKFVGTPTVNRNITIPDKALTVADNADITVLNAQTLIGSANKKYIACKHFISDDDNGAVQYSVLAGSILTNAIAGVNIIRLILDLPPSLGSLKLYVDSFKIAVGDALANEYISNITIKGITANAESPIKDEDMETNIVQEYTVDFTAEDCSSYDYVIAEITFTTGEVGGLDIGLLRIQSYYDA